MQRLINDNWQFTKLPNGSTMDEALLSSWQPVALPHDWLIANTTDLYENSDGWYRRELDIPQQDLEKHVRIRFDGVYMDADVILNGEVILHHPYGYTAFDADLTHRLHAGPNLLMVHVRHQSPNSRWYSGAGIYRDVTLHIENPARILPDGIYVHTAPAEGGWKLDVYTEICGAKAALPLTHRLETADGKMVASWETAAKNGENHSSALIENPALWSHDNPCCYKLYTSFAGDDTVTTVGFRHFVLDKDKGLLVNGKNIKLNGVCLHHDLGALGSAFHEKAARRQLRKMLSMGVNALRTSHNPPARQVLDLCDEMGIYLIDEAFDMWEMSKTQYDYARFFDAHAEKDVAAWVRRDRNHPCVLMWSIGNEIPDTNNESRGPEITQMLLEYVRRHDPLKNAFTTIGSNYMPWKGAQLCAEYIDAVGYNYAEKYYPIHHQEYPEWVIYGSETASLLSSRGIYHFPAASPLLSDEDLQCSALGNSSTSWGAKSFGQCIVGDQRIPYSMGQFIWSGIDYIGEPTPYHTKNCYFGQMDTACFAKDSYYMFRSLWQEKPMVHIGVYWCWNPGQLIDVPVSACAASVELFLNGVSQGRQTLDRTDPIRCSGLWQLPYQPGELLAVGYDENGIEIARDVQRSFSNPAALVLEAEDSVLKADNSDMTFLTITAKDADGHPVHNANNRVHITVEGPAALLGMDNGDSTDTDPYQTDSRRLFSGKLLAIIGALDQPGEITVTVTADGLAPAVLRLSAKAAPTVPGRCRLPLICPTQIPAEEPVVRQILLTPLGSTSLTPDNPSVAFRTECLPAAGQVEYRVLNAAGVETMSASVKATAEGCVVTGQGDGTVYLRALCKNGADHAKVLSHMEITVSGMGQPSLDPYRFVAGGLYTLSHGDITPGNDHGIAFSRDGRSMAGFARIDFGKSGSDLITLPIFALSDDPYEISLWEGDPENGGQWIATLPYHKKSIWNVYQEETYRLPRRLTGVCDLWFVMDKKIHLKGFSFQKQSRAWLMQTAGAADAIYGDSFRRQGDHICDIGNNVSLVFEDVDFEGETEGRLLLQGATPLENQPVNLRITTRNGEQHTQLLQFMKGAGQQVFPVKLYPGNCTVTFVFLPGSRFDLECFRFEKKPE